MNMKVVILAGGAGTRLKEMTGDLPKPMARLDGIPIIEREMELLRDQGFTDVVIGVGVGRGADAIEAYFKGGTGTSPCTGRPFGVNVSYLKEPRPMGSAGMVALAAAEGRLGESFLVLNGDLLIGADLRAMAEAHLASGAKGTTLAHPSSHVADSVLLQEGKDGVVTGVLPRGPKPSLYENLSSAGAAVYRAEAFATAAEKARSGEKADLDADVAFPLVETGDLRVFRTADYVMDVGTPERFRKAEADLRSGKFAAMRTGAKRRAVFIDRDGTLNVPKGHVNDWRNIELLPDAAWAVKRINDAGDLAVLVTNQPVIARGEATEEDVKRVHARLQALLAEEGAWLDGTYVCPHHPDSGFPGERPELKVACACRKPEPGLILEAAKDLNVDLSESWTVGDSWRDVEAGRRAGTGTAFLTEGPRPFAEAGRLEFGSLAAFAEWLETRLDGPAEGPIAELQAREPSLADEADSLREATALVVGSVSDGGKVLACGNGGSAADAGHLCGELAKSFKMKRPLAPGFEERLKGMGEDGEYLAGILEDAIPALALNAGCPTGTAFMNDRGADAVYAQMVNALGGTGDVLVAFSTSGNSRNVVLAALTAKAIGASVVSFTGRDGGRLAEIADVAIRSPQTETYRVQEDHLKLYHALAASVEAAFYGGL